MLKEIIEKNKRNVTTLVVLYVMLDDFIKKASLGLAQDGLISVEISRNYSVIQERLRLKEDYYESYVQRKTGDRSLFDKTGDRYSIRRDLVSNLNIEELRQLNEQIIEILSKRNLFYAEFFAEITAIIEGSDRNASYNYILSMFNESRFRNFGQIFEVLSYSILKIYFESFGFELKRFSTSFSNDGGMDFLSSAGVYQVTSSPTKQKITDDLNKLPGIRRVLVLNECSERIRELCMRSENVTEIITSEDLKFHFLGWLYSRDLYNSKYMLMILDTIKTEMTRESQHKI